jgi:putative Ca2+/H+ antiporter (TMEM165/GDT1 family)
MKEYTEETAAKMKEIAGVAMDSAQSKIDQLNTLGSSARNQISNYLLEWQKWVSTISFSLVAIGGALVAQGSSPHLSVLASFVLFLIVGIWILVEHKRQFERAASTSSIDIDNYRPLYDDKKKAAFDLWEDPKSVEKHLAFLKQEQKIMDYTKTLNSLQNQELSHDKIVYLNDIWLGTFISAIYLLLFPMYEKLSKQYELASFPSNALYCLLLVLFILFVIRDAQKSKPYIAQANKSKRAKTESEARHTYGYSERVKSEIELLEKIIKDPKAKL